MEIHLILCHSLMGPSPGSPPRSVSAQLNPSLFRGGALDEDDDDDDTTALHSDSVASFLISARRRVILFFYPIPPPLDAVGTNLLYLFITRGI